MENNKKNCNTCKHGMLFGNCKELNNNEEFQNILKENKFFNVKEYSFKEKFICDNYKSRYIEYPIEVSKINKSKIYDNYPDNRVGKLVKIRPCGEEYEDKTYLGLFLGELPIGTHISYSEDTKELDVSFHKNPAIFIFSLNKIVHGCESWWGVIDSPEELKEITIEDINDVWYVKLIKELSDKEK